MLGMFTALRISPAAARLDLDRNLEAPTPSFELPPSMPPGAGSARCWAFRNARSPGAFFLEEHRGGCRKCFGFERPDQRRLSIKHRAAQFDDARTPFFAFASRRR